MSLAKDESYVVKTRTRLSKSITTAQFENGYWYATELKKFAEEIGIPSAARLRKDELEKAIIGFLNTGTIETPTKRNLSKEGIRDIDKGLSLDLPIVNYTSNKETKQFIEREAQKVAPGLKRKSGARYRLNRWREEQLTNGVKITYADLVNQYVKLNQTEGRFEKIPQVRYVNFLGDFLSAEKGASREQAIAAWKKLKEIDAPKTYDAWRKLRSSAKED
ncbi:MAG TPA: SAP domain-containing protein [Blastocatellia bacterium]|nr:SAP domain-containing protein [Blastocatellia bacterium]